MCACNRRLFVSLLFVMMCGCSGAPKAAVPELDLTSKFNSVVPSSERGRLEQLARNSPPDSTVLFVGNVNRYVAQSKHFIAYLKPFLSFFNNSLDQIKTHWGIDLADTKACAKAGLLCSSFALVMHKDHVTLAMYTTQSALLNEHLFRVFANQQTKASTQPAKASAAPTKVVQQGGVFTVGEGPEQVGWTHRGVIAFMTMPVVTSASTNASEILKQMPSPDGEDTLFDVPSFAPFAASFFNTRQPNMASMYGDHKSMHRFFSNALLKHSKTPDDSAEGITAPRIMGAGAWYDSEATPMNAQIRFMTTLTEKGRKASDGVGKTPPAVSSSSSINKLATQGMWLGARLNLPRAVLESMWGVLEAEDQRAILESMWGLLGAEGQNSDSKPLSSLSAKHGVDVQRNLLPYLSGRVGLFIYNLHLFKFMNANRSKNGLRLLQVAQGLLAVKVDDKAKVLTWLQKVASHHQSKGASGLSTIKPGHYSLSLKNKLSIHLFDDVLMFDFDSSAGAIAATQLAQKLSAPQIVYGDRFSSGVRFNGVLVNTKSINKGVGSFFQMPFLTNVSGMLVEAHQKQGNLFVDVLMTVDP